MESKGSFPMSSRTCSRRDSQASRTSSGAIGRLEPQVLCLLAGLINPDRRTGGRKNLKLKGLKRMLLGFPKTRGFRSLEPKVAAVPLIRLEGLADGTEVTLKALQDLGLVPRRNLSAKIIGSGPLSKELTVKGVAVTAGAKAAIEKAGGRVI